MTFADKTKNAENASMKSNWGRKPARIQENVPRQSAPMNFLIQRKAGGCACGGGCPTCQTKNSSLPISQPNDASEIEADQIADEVMRIPENKTLSLKNNQFHSKSFSKSVTPIVQTKSESGTAASSKLSGKIASSIGGGSAMNSSTQSFMESRFGADFSGVKIHTNDEAVQMNRELNAKAFTIGSDIYFNKGQYQPNSESGKHLLAHELTHVMQQNLHPHNKSIQKCPDAVSLSEFDTKVTQIRAMREFNRLPPGDRRMAEDILRALRDRNDCIEFIDRFKELFTTPVDQSPAVGAAASAAMASAAESERERLATPEGNRLKDVEENMASSSSRTWETLSPPPRGWGHMATFQIDRSDPNNIVVQAKIRVQGNRADVDNVIAQQDGIEKGAAELGYTLDVIFVSTGGPDVFTVSINPTRPVTAGNWSAYSPDPSAYTHEIHHLLGLEDRYDLSTHATNTTMDVHNRLIWFRVEALRTRDLLRDQSLMGFGQHLLDDDICRVSQLNFAACMAARQTRRDMITNARAAAFRKSFRVFEILSGIRPVAPVPGAPETRDFQTSTIMRMAGQIFGTTVAQDDLSDRIGSMRHRLTPAMTTQPMPPTDSNCTGNAYYVVNMMPPIRLCPEFFSITPDNQEKTFLRAAAQLVRLDNSLPIGLCASDNCLSPCGGYNSADAWTKFITCASSVL